MISASRSWDEVHAALLTLSSKSSAGVRNEALNKIRAVLEDDDACLRIFQGDAGVALSARDACSSSDDDEADEKTQRAAKQIGATRWNLTCSQLLDCVEDMVRKSLVSKKSKSSAIPKPVRDAIGVLRLAATKSGGKSGIRSDETMSRLLHFCIVHLRNDIHFTEIGLEYVQIIRHLCARDPVPEHRFRLSSEELDRVRKLCLTRLRSTYNEDLSGPNMAKVLNWCTRTTDYNVTAHFENSIVKNISRFFQRAGVEREAMSQHAEVDREMLDLLSGLIEARGRAIYPILRTYEDLIPDFVLKVASRLPVNALVRAQALRCLRLQLRLFADRAKSWGCRPAQYFIEEGDELSPKLLTKVEMIANTVFGGTLKIPEISNAFDGQLAAADAFPIQMDLAADLMHYLSFIKPSALADLRKGQTVERALTFEELLDNVLQVMVASARSVARRRGEVSGPRFTPWLQLLCSYFKLHPDDGSHILHNHLEECLKCMLDILQLQGRTMREIEWGLLCFMTILRSPDVHRHRELWRDLWKHIFQVLIPKSPPLRPLCFEFILAVINHQQKILDQADVRFQLEYFWNVEMFDVPLNSNIPMDLNQEIDHSEEDFELPRQNDSLMDAPIPYNLARVVFELVQFEQRSKYRIAALIWTLKWTQVVSTDAIDHPDFIKLLGSLVSLLAFPGKEQLVSRFMKAQFQGLHDDFFVSGPRSAERKIQASQFALLTGTMQKECSDSLLRRELKSNRRRVLKQLFSILPQQVLRCQGQHEVFDCLNKSVDLLGEDKLDEHVDVLGDIGKVIIEIDRGLYSVLEHSSTNRMHDSRGLGRPSKKRKMEEENLGQPRKKKMTKSSSTLSVTSNEEGEDGDIDDDDEDDDDFAAEFAVTSSTLSLSSSASNQNVTKKDRKKGKNMSSALAPFTAKVQMRKRLDARKVPFLISNLLRVMSCATDDVKLLDKLLIDCHGALAVQVLEVYAEVIEREEFENALSCFKALSKAICRFESDVNVLTGLVRVLANLCKKEELWRGHVDVANMMAEFFLENEHPLLGDVGNSQFIKEIRLCAKSSSLLLPNDLREDLLRCFCTLGEVWLRHSHVEGKKLATYVIFGGFMDDDSRICDLACRICPSVLQKLRSGSGEAFRVMRGFMFQMKERTRTLEGLPLCLVGVDGLGEMDASQITQMQDDWDGTTNEAKGEAQVMHETRRDEAIWRNWKILASLASSMDELLRPILFRFAIFGRDLQKAPKRVMQQRYLRHLVGEIAKARKSENLFYTFCEFICINWMKHSPEPNTGINFRMFDAHHNFAMMVAMPNLYIGALLNSRVEGAKKDMLVPVCKAHKREASEDTFRRCTNKWKWELLGALGPQHDEILRDWVRDSRAEFPKDDVLGQTKAFCQALTILSLEGGPFGDFAGFDFETFRNWTEKTFGNDFLVKKANAVEIILHLNYRMFLSAKGAAKVNTEMLKWMCEAEVFLSQRLAFEVAIDNILLHLVRKVEVCTCAEALEHLGRIMRSRFSSGWYKDSLIVTIILESLVEGFQELEPALQIWSGGTGREVIRWYLSSDESRVRKMVTISPEVYGPVFVELLKRFTGTVDENLRLALFELVPDVTVEVQMSIAAIVGATGPKNCDSLFVSHAARERERKVKREDGFTEICSYMFMMLSHPDATLASASFEGLRCMILDEKEYPRFAALAEKARESKRRGSIVLTSPLATEKARKVESQFRRSCGGKLEPNPEAKFEDWVRMFAHNFSQSLEDGNALGYIAELCLLDSKFAALALPRFVHCKASTTTPRSKERKKLVKVLEPFLESRVDDRKQVMVLECLGFHRRRVLSSGEATAKLDDFLACFDVNFVAEAALRCKMPCTALIFLEHFVDVNTKELHRLKFEAYLLLGAAVSGDELAGVGEFTKEAKMQYAKMYFAKRNWLEALTTLDDVGERREAMENLGIALEKRRDITLDEACIALKKRDLGWFRIHCF